MDKVKHEINAALSWLEEGNVERAKLHLGFALAHLGDEEAQQSVQSTRFCACGEVIEPDEYRCPTCREAEHARG